MQYKRHGNKLQHSVMYKSYFRWAGDGYTDDLSGTQEQNRGLGGVNK